MEVYLTDGQYDAIVSSAHAWLTSLAGCGATLEVEGLAIIALLAVACGLLFAQILVSRWHA